MRAPPQRGYGVLLELKHSVGICTCVATVHTLICPAHRLRDHWILAARRFSVAHFVGFRVDPESPSVVDPLCAHPTAFCCEVDIGLFFDRTGAAVEDDGGLRT